MLSRYSVEIFLSHNAENIRRGNPLVFHLIRLSRSLDKRGRVLRFSVENFLSECRKNSVGETFFVALISGIEKNWIRGGLSGFSVSQCQKLSQGNPFVFHKFWLPKKFMI